MGLGMDTIYFERRAGEERIAAMKAAHPRARQVHLELAEAYERRARMIEVEARRSGFRLVTAA